MLRPVLRGAKPAATGAARLTAIQDTRALLEAALRKLETIGQ